MKRIVLASGNAGKLAEFKALFDSHCLDIHPQSTYGIAEVEETGLSFVENALLKARHAARISGLPALSDDSGLCVTVLDDAPGLYSARYAGAHGNADANNAKLLAALKGRPASQRNAYFICVLVLLRHAQDPAPLIAEGRWKGRILPAPRGDRGFGYDPLFLPEDSALSAAELAPAEKNRLSHRSQALAQLRQALRNVPSL